MARNLFLLAGLALLAGCNTPAEPPSTSGVDDTAVIPAAPAAPAPATPAAPAAVPAKGKLPLGEVRRK